VPFRAGQTYLYPLGDASLTGHLWVIATEPDDSGQFATVSLTSLKGAKDQTVIFRKAEHPFLKWDTCVLYALAEITSTARLESYIDSGRAKMHQDASPEMLRLVLDGFSASEHTKNRVLNFIRAYKQARR
jgi:hypothetical protein